MNKNNKFMVTKVTQNIEDTPKILHQQELKIYLATEGSNYRRSDYTEYNKTYCID